MLKKAEELANIYTADLNNEEFKFKIGFKRHTLCADILKDPHQQKFEEIFIKMNWKKATRTSLLH